MYMFIEHFYYLYLDTNVYITFNYIYIDTNVYVYITFLLYIHRYNRNKQICSATPSFTSGDDPQAE